MKWPAVVAAAVVAAAVASLALPAGAKPPLSATARLELKIDTLRARIGRLESQKRESARWQASAQRRERALARRLAVVDSCRVTTPNGSPPPGSTFGSDFHGNGTLWAGLYPANVVVAEPEADGSIAAKVGWWRGASGALAVEGRRLDEPASPLRALVPDGYGDSGFQSTSLVFPEPGCWEVTGRLGGSTLGFVTLVLAA